MVVTTHPVSGQAMKELIEKLIAETKVKDTNTLLNYGGSFSIKYGHAENSEQLKAFVERCGTTFNVCWKMLEDASEYRVEVYKYKDRWYKLTEISIERNNGYVAITDLVGDGYVFRVIAEDRSGNMLARSAGVVIGFDTID